VPTRKAQLMGQPAARFTFLWLPPTKAKAVVGELVASGGATTAVVGMEEAAP